LQINQQDRRVRRGKRGREVEGHGALQSERPGRPRHSKAPAVAVVRTSLSASRGRVYYISHDG